MVAATAALGERPPLSWPTKIAYSLGAVSQAVKTRVISVFLLLYYNQIVGLDAALVSSLIMVTVIFDALVDPAVGQASDNFKSKLGRRHPFMYAAAVPAALLFYMLWNPPTGWSPMITATYFFVVLIALKFFDTFFELPALSLLPELAQEYDKRTQLVAMRNFCSNIAGLGIIMLAYQVFLKENPDGTGGALAGDGYHNLSLAVAITMFCAIMIATLGTHGQIKYLRPAPKKTPTIKQMFKEAGATLNNRSFVSTALAGMCMAVSVGMKSALDIYWYLYLFGMKQSQVALITMIGMGGTLLGVVLGPLLIKKFGKQRAAMGVFLCSLVLTTGPITLWLLGLTPPNGSNALFALLAVDQMLNAGMWFIIGICTLSMLADVVEDAEVKTGRRSEGLLFSAENLFKKMVGGLGVFSAGLLLSFAAFPKGAERGTVPDEILTHLALYYLPAVALLHLGAIIALTLFRIDRAKHESNLAELKDRGAAPAAAADGAPYGVGPVVRPGDTPA